MCTYYFQLQVQKATMYFHDLVDDALIHRLLIWGYNFGRSYVYPYLSSLLMMMIMMIVMIVVMMMMMMMIIIIIIIIIIIKMYVSLLSCSTLRLFTDKLLNAILYLCNSLNTSRQKLKSIG